MARLSYLPKLSLFSALSMLLIVALPVIASMDKTEGQRKRAKAVREVLAGEGLNKSSIDKATAGYESLDISPEKNIAPVPERHFYNNRIRNGQEFIKAQRKSALTLAGSAYKSPAKQSLTLFHLGKAIHTAQDFYFNSNYIELLLSQKRDLRPVRWDNVPADIKSGFSWWKTAINNDSILGRSVVVRNITDHYKKNGKKLLFHSQQQWEARQKTESCKKALEYTVNPLLDLLDVELTKGSSGSLQGRVVVSQGRHRGRTLHALASSLARKETARQWKNFCIAIKQKYGERAALILPALTGDELPTLQLSVKARATAQRGRTISGYIIVTIKNASYPLSVDITAKSSGKNSARYVLKNKTTGVYRVNMKSKLPITPSKAGRERLSVLASFPADPGFRPVEEDMVVSVIARP